MTSASFEVPRLVTVYGGEPKGGTFAHPCEVFNVSTTCRFLMLSSSHHEIAIHVNPQLKLSSRYVS